MLSCIFNTEVDQEPRIEWKKTGKDVSFVYFKDHFRGENQRILIGHDEETPGRQE